MQNDLHHWLGQLPKIERSPEAVSRARERALKKKKEGSGCTLNFLSMEKATLQKLQVI